MMVLYRAIYCVVQSALISLLLLLFVLLLANKLQL